MKVNKQYTKKEISKKNNKFFSNFHYFRIIFYKPILDIKYFFSKAESINFLLVINKNTYATLCLVN